jgi:hypothetical protein
MIDFTEISDGDGWEAFCRDYLIALGLVVEIPPARGADGGMDLLVREQLKGALASRPFTWLVSCKHFAVSKKAVGNADEMNIVDRLEQYKADGFIGFYSTTASAALVTKLKEFRESGKIEAFEIYDGSRIENGFHDAGLSGVLLQHLSQSHTALRPIHPLLGTYQPLPCDVCGKDLLKATLTEEYSGMITFGSRIEEDHDERVVERVAFVCKGACGGKMELKHFRLDLTEGWDDITDYCNPLIFIRRITGYINELRSGSTKYSQAAHDRMIDFYMALSQRTLRQTSAEDRQKLLEVMELDGVGL